MLKASITFSCVVFMYGSLAASHDHEHGARPLEFHENLGQWPQQVLYRALTLGGALFVEPSAFTHVLRTGGPQHAQPKDAPHEPYREHAYRVHFVGGAAKTHVGTERQAHYANYFIGDDPSKWAGGVGVYTGTLLKEVYPGIDLNIDGHNGLKYDWNLAAGADPSRIILEFEGQDRLWVEGGLLFVRTTAGQVVEQRPVAWSVKEGRKVPVRCEYRLDSHRVGYHFPDGHDSSAPLVIDPVVVFSSYVGSFADNFGFTATYDATGHLYGAGIVFGVGYPNTIGVQQATFGGGTIDIGVSKFTPAGNALVWSTYLGGSENDAPHSLVVNSADELYVLGTSGSGNFPVTAGAMDPTFNGGAFISLNASYGFSHANGVDIVVAHLNSTATALIGSTYVGGTGNDGVNSAVTLAYNYGDPFRGEIALDALERPVVATCTGSQGLTTSAGAPQSTYGGGGLDGYAFRLDPALTTLLWATYVGGSGDDAAYGVQFAGDGNIYITGGTTSPNLTIPGPAYDNTANGGADGFIARYAADGSSLLGATYVGTSAYDQCYFVQLDLNGGVYVVGQTHGAYPVTPGKYANPAGSQFIHKLSADLSTSEWSTRIGSNGTEDISPSAFLVSDCGQIYFSGWGGAVNTFAQAFASTTFGLPVTADAYQPGTDGSDFYLMVLNTEAESLAYATFFGGTATEHVDGGTSRFDKHGIVYQAVCAGCGFGATTFPTTPGAWSNTDNGMNCNLGVFKIDFEQNVQVNIDANINVSGACITEPIVFNAVGTADSWTWDLGDGTISTETTLAHLFAVPGTYTITLIGTATGLCVAVDTATMQITVVAPADLQPSFDAIPTGSCDALSVELFNTSTGSETYFWQFGDGSTSTATNPVHPYGSPGVYSIILGLIDPVCNDTAFTTVTVPVQIPGVTLDLVSPVAICDGESVFLGAGAGFDSYLWNTGDPTMMIAVSDPGTYSVVVTDGFCTGGDTISVVTSPGHGSIPDFIVCPGEPALLVLGAPVQGVLWSTGDTTSVLSTLLAGVYWFDALDQFGCLWTDTIQVNVIAAATSAPVIPNVFSPNGDRFNALFLVQGVDVASFNLEIYDRWGIKVFGTTNALVGWNGKVENTGDALPDGTYFYILTYKDDCSRIPLTTKTGHITLLR